MVGSALARIFPRGDRRGPLVAAGTLVGAAGAAAWQGWGAAALLVGAAAATRAIVPLVARYALRRNAAVLPGGRYAHSAKTPLLGGLAIALPFLAFLVAQGTPHALGFALGAFLITAVGAYDDMRGISPRGKLLGQTAAALVLVGTGHHVPELLFPPWGSIPTTGFEIPLIVFWVVLVTNAINLIDGMDGLAATVALVAALAGTAFVGDPLPPLVLAGAILGFLRFNLPPARLFLGDSGSLLLGFSTAALALDGPASVNVPVALGLVALPVGDAALTTIRRWVRGKPVFVGDRGHVHHRLVDAWRSPSRVLLVLGLFAAAHAAAAVAFPDVRALGISTILWGALGLYLLALARQRLVRILLDRKTFRRLHLARHYATEALRLAERDADVVAVLDRMAGDFGLASLRVGALRVERASPAGELQVEEHIDCGDTVASWSAAFSHLDEVLAEERRTVLCDILRLAHRRLVALGSTAYRMATEPVHAPVPAAASGRPTVHFIAEGRDRLARIAPLVRETRRRGTLEPVVVHTGRRDDLGITAAQVRELGLEGPDIDLDVAPADAMVLAARVMERYHLLLETGRPAVVVVGESEAALACALVAKERGVAVAQISAPGGDTSQRPLLRMLRESLADLTLAARPEPGEGGQLYIIDGAGRVREGDAADLIPALEALLAAPAGF
jgi:UDP-GlcNAc:undecaprenyl-phosphate GlcNAc-1-phosphate transferase